MKEMLNETPNITPIDMHEKELERTETKKQRRRTSKVTQVRNLHNVTL